MMKLLIAVCLAFFMVSCGVQEEPVPEETVPAERVFIYEDIVGRSAVRIRQHRR